MSLEKEEIKSCEERIKQLLVMTPPKGKEFLHSIKHILEREMNWVWWKRDGCAPFEKQPAEKKSAQDGVRKRRLRWRLGNKELSQLWNWADQNPNALTDTQRVRTPAIMDYWKPLAEDKIEGFLAILKITGGSFSPHPQKLPFTVTSVDGNKYLLYYSSLDLA